MWEKGTQEEGPTTEEMCPAYQGSLTDEAQSCQGQWESPGLYLWRWPVGAH